MYIRQNGLGQGKLGAQSCWCLVLIQGWVVVVSSIYLYLWEFQESRQTGHSRTSDNWCLSSLESFEILEQREETVSLSTSQQGEGVAQWADNSLRWRRDKALISHIETHVFHSQWVFWVQQRASCVFLPRTPVSSYTEAASRDLKSLWSLKSQTIQGYLKELYLLGMGWGTNPLVLREGKQSRDCRIGDSSK